MAEIETTVTESTQPRLPGLLGDSGPIAIAEGNGRANKLAASDRAVHDWYRFVLSFPPHLVRSYLRDFGLSSGQTVLDPFCGTGTTLVEAKKNGLRAVGLEANPFAHFASSVKTDWAINGAELAQQARDIAAQAKQMLAAQGLSDRQPFEKLPDNLALRGLETEAAQLILTNSISPLPLHKTLVLLDCLERHTEQPHYRHARLALGNALVFQFSNLHFGPEVGVGKPKIDYPVVPAWLAEVEGMARCPG